VGNVRANFEISNARLGQHGVQNARVERSTIWHQRLEDRQSGSDGDMMRDEIVNHVLDGLTGNVQIEEPLQRGIRVGTFSMLFRRKKFRVHEQAMLQVINAKSGGFAKTDGTKMSGNFYSMRMSGFDRGGELLRSDGHVSLKRSHSLCDPVFN